MPLILPLAEVSDSDIALVGGKAGKLGEVVRQGLPVPPGFVITTEAYEAFVAGTALKTVIPNALGTLDPARPETVEQVAQAIRKAFESTAFPKALREPIMEAYERYRQEHSVRFSAVRSSATAEDLEGASFAGLQETYLNVTGTEEILKAVRKCWGSLFTARVLVYRARKGFDHSAVRLAVLVQKMVDSVVSGILFTRDPNTGENHMIIEAGWGLGEAIVGGEVTQTTTWSTERPSASSTSRYPSKRFGWFVPIPGGNRHEEVPADERSAQKLPTNASNDWPRWLASSSPTISRPMDVEWCADDQNLYIVQARPVTTIPAGSGDVSGGPFDARRGRSSPPSHACRTRSRRSCAGSARAPALRAAQRDCYQGLRNGETEIRRSPRDDDDRAGHGAGDGAGRRDYHGRRGDDLPRGDRLSRARCPLRRRHPNRDQGDRRGKSRVGRREDRERVSRPRTGHEGGRRDLHQLGTDPERSS